MSETVDLAELVVADLAARVETFGLTGWTPKRAFVPRFDLASIKWLQVVVCPASRTGSRETRGLIGRRIGLYVGVLKLLAPGSSDQVSPPADLSELDGLCGFVEELDNLFVPKNGDPYCLQDGGRSFMALESSVAPLYDPALMHDRRQFTSVLTVEFQVF